MNCSLGHPNNDTLRDYLNGSLDQSNEGQVGSHLDSCEDCQATVEQLIGKTFSILSDGDVLNQFVDSQQESEASATGRLPQFRIGSKFLLIRELAHGGMGVVYRGFDRELQREVAIKVLIGDQHASKNARFYREAQISGQLQHPGIIPVYEQGQLNDGRLFIALKLVEGLTLLNLIRSDEPNLAKNLDVFGSVSQTMAYAHSRDFIHRDLKPENIMVGQFGEVQVLDWGLGRKLDVVASEQTKGAGPDKKNCVSNAAPGATRQGDVLGTPAYIPPEQARGDRADKRTDVFALGGILCEILTGQPPFSAPTATAALQQSLTNDIQATFERLDQSGNDDRLVHLVKSCLATDPNNRPADAQEVSQRFSEYLDGREREFELAKLEKARTAERLISQQKRNRQVAWFSAAIIAALGAFAFAGYSYLTEKNRRQSDQAKVELEQVKRQSEEENQIRVNLASANTFRELAREGDSESSPEHWQSALFEIRQANSRESNISEALSKELDSISDEIQKESEVFFESKTRVEKEFACREKIRRICYRSVYPPDLRLALIDRLSDEFAAAYAEIGVTPGNLSDESVNRISNSNYNAFLMHGLFFWRVEIARESRRYGPRDNDDTVRDWIDSLITKAEKNPLRIRIRSAIRNGKNRTIGRFMQSEEATDSLASVLLCTQLVEYLKNDEQKVDYLLRAQQAFPDEFQVRWKLSAVNGLGSKEQEELGLRSALACYALQPEHPGVWMNLGATYIQQANYPQAIGMLEQVVEIAPNFIDAKFNLARAYWENEQADLALNSLTEILDNSKDYFWAHLLKAVIHRKMGQTDKAIEGFQRATTLNKKHNLAHYNLFEIYRDRNEMDKAIVYLEKAVDNQPKNLTYLKQLASSYQTMEKWDSAEKTFNQVLKTNPTDSQTLASIANLYLVKNQPVDGENLLRNAIYNGVNGHTIQLELAKSLLAQSGDDVESAKRAEAIQILKKLKEFSPGLKEAATILRKQGEL